jgi:UDP-2,3-diacylglucosamine pyrophosphatase LpxH
LIDGGQTSCVSRSRLPVVDPSVFSARTPEPVLSRRSGGFAPERAVAAGGAAPLDFRAVFVSDVHLGAAGVRDDLLLEFLRAARFDALYLLGDFVDGLLSKWTVAIDRHAELLHELWSLARRGVRVLYVPGNHDAFARRYAGLRLGEVSLEREAVHETAEGRRMWLVHGDEFDRASRGLTAFGDAAGAVALGAARFVNAIRAACGGSYRPYASHVRRKVRTSVPYLVAYERRAAEEARRRGFDGVICGHLHVPAIERFDGIVYGNDGDWVDSCTALGETRAGELTLIDWPRRRLVGRILRAREDAATADAGLRKSTPRLPRIAEVANPQADIRAGRPASAAGAPYRGGVGEA